MQSPPVLNPNGGAILLDIEEKNLKSLQNQDRKLISGEAP